MPTFKVSDVRCVQYDFSISINASRQRVWKVLTEQVGDWWLPDFHMLGPHSLVQLEPRAGGRLYEHSDAGELLWYTVLSIAPEESLNLVGYCTAEFGGPSTTMLTVRLKADGKSTRLTITDSLFGHVSDDHASSLCSRWTQLFNDGLKAHIES